MALAAATARRPPATQIGTAAAGLLLATIAELGLATAAGAPPPLADAARGLAAATALWALLTLAGRLFRRRWMLLAAGWAALLVPGVLPVWQRAVRRPDPPATAPPVVAVLSGLPIMWGDPRERAAATLLARRLRLHPIDDPQAIATARFALIAQPRPPGPAGLVAIDRWVRRGGRAVILTDEALRWAEARRPGDPLRPPGNDGLAPLLAHWGLAHTPGGHGVVPLTLGARRLLLVDPGRFVATGPACRVHADGRIADCAIGRGRVRLLADADLLHPDAWIGAAPDRAHRVADNPLFLTDAIERFAGRADHAAAVDWAVRGENR